MRAQWASAVVKSVQSVLVRDMSAVMAMRAIKKRSRVVSAASSLRPIAATALAIAIFVVDSVTDLEIAVAVFYVAVVLMSISFLQKRGVLLVSAGCMLLTLLSYFLTPEGDPRSGLINCLISLSALGITTYLALKSASAQSAVHEARAHLAHIARVTTLGELTTSIAHEVNQPLAAVVTNGNACLRWLAGQPPNLAEARRTIEQIVEDANRASEVVQRIRRLAKGAPPLKDWLNINDTIVETIVLTRSEVQRNRISLRVQLADDLPPVLGDGVQLQQVILNLIINAIEAINATSDGPRELTVRSTKGVANGVQLAVSDSGIGLDPSRHDQIFDAFHTTKPDGMGMGLTISRAIAEAHGGSIRAAPRAPRGTVIRRMRRDKVRPLHPSGARWALDERRPVHRIRRR
jgi:signal transduction histidine kinase